MDNWHRFLGKKRYGVMISEFFTKVNNEVANVETESDSEGKKGILLLNTKKGYWMYKLFEREEKKKGNKKVKTIEVCSDRYVKKDDDFSRLKGKWIYLLDDTLTHGFGLMETYKLLARNIDESYICPVVFALDDSVNLQERQKSADDEVSANFWRKLKFYVKMPSEDLSELCLSETVLLHREGIPFVIDLPYLKRNEVKSEEMNFEVILADGQFKKFCSGNDLWDYHPVSYPISGLLLDDKEENNMHDIQGFILQMRDADLLEKTKEFALDLVVEGTYVLDDEGRAHMVFIPFAIFKSMTKEYLEQLYHAIFEEKEFITTKGDNIYVKCYRECAYAISMMIAEYFKKYLYCNTGVELDYDYQILSDHFPLDSIRRLQHLEDVLRENLEIINEKLTKIRGLRNRYKGRYEIGQYVYKKEPYMADRAYNVIFDEIRERRQKFVQQKGKRKEKPDKLAAIVSFEEMQQLLQQHFSFESKEQERYALTEILVIVLQESICNNQVMPSADGSSMVKGARYGENTDLILPFFDLRFYWAIVLMAEKSGTVKLLDIYDRFVSELQQQYEKYDLFKRDVTLEVFRKNRDYYESVLRNGSQLYNKFFYLKPYFQGKQDKYTASFMERIEEFVQEYKV